MIVVGLRQDATKILNNLVWFSKSFCIFLNLNFSNLRCLDIRNDISLSWKFNLFWLVYFILFTNSCPHLIKLNLNRKTEQWLKIRSQQATHHQINQTGISFFIIFIQFILIINDLIREMIKTFERKCDFLQVLHYLLARLVPSRIGLNGLIGAVVLMESIIDLDVVMQIVMEDLVRFSD